jgi:hypothetical protein
MFINGQRVELRAWVKFVLRLIFRPYVLPQNPQTQKSRLASLAIAYERGYAQGRALVNSLPIHGHSQSTDEEAV